VLLGFVGAYCEGSLSLSLSPSLTRSPFPPRLSSNRTCGFPASGSRTDFTWGIRRTRLLRFGLHVELLLELFELCRGCQARANLPLVHSSRKHSEPGPLPSTVVTRFSGTMGPSDSCARHALSACSVFTPHAQASRVAHSTFARMPRPLSRWATRLGRLLPPGTSAFPVFGTGRRPRQSSRDLLRLHSRCGLRTRSTSFQGPSSSGLRFR
jgi:hypothetical protein